MNNDYKGPVRIIQGCPLVWLPAKALNNTIGWGRWECFTFGGGSSLLEGNTLRIGRVYSSRVNIGQQPKGGKSSLSIGNILALLTVGGHKSVINMMPHYTLWIDLSKPYKPNGKFTPEEIPKQKER